MKVVTNMLDTVILQLKHGQYSILQFERFSPSLTKELMNRNGFVKAVNNPTKDEKQSGYYPRITWIKRGGTLNLKIECSVAKLIHGNNVDEVDEQDFSQAVKVLHERMTRMGIAVFTHVLENAEVLSFHPSKNIQLKNGYTSTFAINELSKINLAQYLDLNKTDFRNSGHSTQFYAVSNSFVLYDKIADLRKPRSRAIDKDQTPCQRTIFEALNERQARIELLRMEVRLSNKRKMNQIMKKLNEPESPMFRQVFNKRLCQKVLWHYWNTYVSKHNSFLFDLETNPQRLLQRLFMNNPNMTHRKAVFLVGLDLLSRDKDGMRGLRNLIDGCGNTRAWESISKDLKALNVQMSVGQQHGFIGQIETELKRFEPFRLNESKVDTLKHSNYTTNI